MRATHILWDTDGDENALESLPTEMPLPQNIDHDEIADYLSDQTGWLVSGFWVEPDAHIVRSDLNLDLPPVIGTVMPELRIYKLSSPADLADVCFTLYEEAPMAKIRSMQGATYPCLALFAVNPQLQTGECLGPARKIMADLTHAFKTAMKAFDDGNPPKDYSDPENPESPKDPKGAV